MMLDPFSLLHPYCLVSLSGDFTVYTCAHRRFQTRALTRPPRKKKPAPKDENTFEGWFMCSWYEILWCYYSRQEYVSWSLLVTWLLMLLFNWHILLNPSKITQGGCLAQGHPAFHGNLCFKDAITLHQSPLSNISNVSNISIWLGGPALSLFASTTCNLQLQKLGLHESRHTVCFLTWKCI